MVLVPDLKDALPERFRINSSDTGRCFTSTKGLDREDRRMLEAERAP